MKQFFKWSMLAILFAGTLFTISCKEDLTDIGSGLLDTGSTGNTYYLDLISYNTNSDSVRTDAKVLPSGAVGIYKDPLFGTANAKFYSQVRLGRLNPAFGGENPEMDSVILKIPVYFKDKADDIKIDTTYIYLDENEEPSDTATIRIKRTYKLDSIYGNSTQPMKLEIREVNQYLYSLDSLYYSNKNLPPCEGCENRNNIEVLPQVLGSTQVGNELVTYQQKKLNDPANESAPPVVLNIKLDKDYFDQKFIGNVGSSDMTDNASFIRNFFRGIEISSPDSDGFLMNFKNNSPEFNIVLHYSYDNPKEEEEDDEDYKARLNGSLPLSLLSYWAVPSEFNVQFVQIEHSNRNPEYVNAYTNPNTTQGDSRLYLSGMDGTKAVLKINEEELNFLKEKVKNENWAIIGAELSLYIDDSYNYSKPSYLFAWNRFQRNEKTKNESFSDLANFLNFYPTAVQFNPIYDFKEDSGKYIIRITDFIKELVEERKEFEDNEIVLDVGNFLLSPNNNYTDIIDKENPFLNNRAFNPHRVVLHGNNTGDQDKRLRLKIYYTKK